MKKIYLLFIAVALAACSAEPVEAELNSLDATVSGKGKLATQEVEKSLDIPEDLCAGEEATFTLNFPQRTNPKGKELSTHIFLQLLVEGDNPETAEVEVSYYYDIINEQVSGAGPVDATYTFNEGGTYQMQYKIGGEGATPFSVTVDNCGCINELKADLTCGDLNTLNLTFTAEEAGPVVIQGGLTNETNITYSHSNLLDRNLTHPSVVKTSNTASVTRWEGSVEACEVVTITIEFTGGNGVGDWSAKRGEDGDEEILGETEEITCSSED